MSSDARHVARADRSHQRPRSVANAVLSEHSRPAPPVGPDGISGGCSPQAGFDLKPTPHDRQAASRRFQMDTTRRNHRCLPHERCSCFEGLREQRILTCVPLARGGSASCVVLSQRYARHDENEPARAERQHCGRLLCRLGVLLWVGLRQSRFFSGYPMAVVRRLRRCAANPRLLDQARPFRTFSRVATSLLPTLLSPAMASRCWLRGRTLPSSQL